MNHIEHLKETTHQKLSETVSDIEQMNRLIKKYELIHKKFSEFDIYSEYLLSLIETLKYRLFLGFLMSDICSSLNVYNNAKTLYEEKFAVRNFIVIVNEGFKKIYNFTKINNQGDTVYKYRNNSFWIKNIKPIIYDDIKELKDSYDDVTKQLDEFLSFNFDEIKMNRDLSIHYDKNPQLIYDMMISLDLEKEKELVLKFMDLINSMFQFTEILCGKFLEKMDKSEKELDEKMTESIEEIYSLLRL